ncbi:MAG: hypothetical protein OEU92_28925, partial [Alphaproteobacteria bacterium]|nr:hypothetical protein [Alphaproteobacteria bacterium]
MRTRGIDALVVQPAQGLYGERCGLWIAGVSRSHSGEIERLGLTARPDVSAIVASNIHPVFDQIIDHGGVGEGRGVAELVVLV